MNKKFLIVFITIFVVSFSSYAFNDYGLRHYHKAVSINYLMEERVNWAVELIGEKGNDALKDIKEENKQSGVSIFVIDPQNGKVVESPEIISLVDDKEINIFGLNPKVFSRSVIEKTVKKLTSTDWDQFVSLITPMDLQEHYAKVALTPKGETYVVATARKDAELAKEIIKQIVDKAGSLIKDEGIEKAKAEFNKKGSDFRHNNTYVYVLNEEGKYLVNPNYPSIVNKNMYDYPGPNKTYPVKKIINSVKDNNTSWIYTKSLKPESKVSDRIEEDQKGEGLKEKLSYVKKIHANDNVYIVGTGTYLE